MKRTLCTLFLLLPLAMSIGCVEIKVTDGQQSEKAAPKADEATPGSSLVSFQRPPMTADKTTRSASPTSDKWTAEKQKDEPKRAKLTDRDGDKIPPTALDIEQKLEEIVRRGNEPVRKLFGELTEQMKDVRKAYTELAAQVERLDGDNQVVRKQMATMLQQIDLLSRKLIELAGEVDEARRKPANGSPFRGTGEIDEQNEAFRKEIQSLREEIERLKKTKPDSANGGKVTRPQPQPISWKASNATLPCGYQLPGVLVPTGGTWFECPRCHKLAWVP